LAKIFLTTKNVTPIVFVLSSGADPINQLRSFASSQGKEWGQNVKALSLG